MPQSSDRVSWHLAKINMILHNEFNQRQRSKTVVSEGKGLSWSKSEGLGSTPAYGMGALLWALPSSVDPTKNYHHAAWEGVNINASLGGGLFRLSAHAAEDTSSAHKRWVLQVFQVCFSTHWEIRVGKIQQFSLRSWLDKLHLRFGNAVEYWYCFSAFPLVHQPIFKSPWSEAQLSSLCCLPSHTHLQSLPIAVVAQTGL